MFRILMECESNFSFYVIEGMFYLLGDWILFCGGRGVVGCVCYILMLIGLPCLGGGEMPPVKTSLHLVN